MSQVKENDVIDQTYHYGYEKNFRTALPQFLAVSVKNLLLLSYGMTLGFPTILIPAVKDPMLGEVLHLETSEISWISSINLIVVPLGCAMSGVVTTPLGRRRAMQMVNIPFFIAWLIFYFSTTTSHLYGALVLTGLAGGLLEAPVIICIIITVIILQIFFIIPVFTVAIVWSDCLTQQFSLAYKVLTYVAEITQPHLRGALTATSSMCIIIGVFTQFLFGLIFYWRTVALINIIFTVLAVVALCFVPESPHWLVSRKRVEDAKKSLQWLRGWTSSQAVECELKDIEALHKHKKGESGQEETFSDKISLYLNRSFIVPYFLVSYAFFVGHFSGMTTLQTYAVSIFQMLQAPIDKYYATLILGILQILGSGTCVILVHYTGKRPLTFFSTAAAGVCCLLVAGYDGYVKTHNLSNSQVNSSDFNETLPGTNGVSYTYSWMPTTLLMLLALVTHTGIRLLPWILIGEVFSAKTRSGAAGLASAIGYIFGFLTNKMYISMVDNFSIWGTYGFYGIVCLSGTIVFYFILPETEGKKLNDIENHFAGVKSLTNEVYRSKKMSSKEVSRLRDLKGTVNPTFEADNTIL